LFGHNGAGKSTLLKILAGAQPQDEGVLSIGDERFTLASPRDALAKGIACVYQELRLIPNLTVTENLFLGREMNRAGLKQIQEMRSYARQMLAEHGLTMDPDRPVSTLSHPEKQLVEVVANLDRNARFLFLDEPTTALNGEQSTQLLNDVRRIAQQRDIGVVLVSHKLDEVLPVCDEATVLSGGRVVFDATSGRLDKQRIVDAIVGDAQVHVPREHRPLQTDARDHLIVEDLAGPRLAGVSLGAKHGEVLGIYGLAGSGRTRFLRSLYGMEPITRGTILLDGRPYRPRNPGHAMASGVALLTEERKVDGFIPLMSAYKNVVVSTLDRYRRGGFLDGQSCEQSARTTLARIGARGRLHGPIKALSGGNQQKVLLARIIEQGADLILLDEPTKGVDIGARADIYALIRKLAEEGRCVVVVSSEEEELISLSDRIAVFNHGRCERPPVFVQEMSLGRLRQDAWASVTPKATA